MPVLGLKCYVMQVRNSWGRGQGPSKVPQMVSQILHPDPAPDHCTWCKMWGNRSTVLQVTVSICPPAGEVPGLSHLAQMCINPWEFILFSGKLTAKKARGRDTTEHHLDPWRGGMFLLNLSLSHSLSPTHTSFSISFFIFLSLHSFYS